MRIALPLYVLGLLLLVGVALFGEVANGARRWLNVGVTRIQPSEIMKIAVPLMLAWYFDRYEATLKLQELFRSPRVLLLVPVGADRAPARSRHRGADVRRRLLRAVPRRPVLAHHRRPRRCRRCASLPLLWSVMHDYQRQRILTLLDPTQDPLGSRLSHHPVDDRGRLRRHLRQGLAERHADPSRFHARAHHRFHFRGLLRRIRPARQHAAAVPVPAGDRRAAW